MSMKHGRADILLFIRNIVILFAASLLVLVVINRSGVYPWGWDTYGHLFKGEILYESLKKGELFLKFNESWYNGIQPYRYWAPMPYYILAVINLLTNNIIVTYNVFIVFIFILGGLGWLCWGNYSGRQNLGLIFGLLWFFVPNNLRILFAEGNLPYVIVNSLVPYVLLYYYKSLREDRISNYIMLAFVMFIITLNHAMLSAMTGLSLFILAFIDSAINKRYIKHLLVLIFAFMGIMTASFWLYPALKGGIMAMDKSSVANVMETLTYPLVQSLNPLGRFSYNQAYYFGLAFAFTAFFGLLLSTRKQWAPFMAAVIILFGTTKAALPLLEKLPMNQLFWMNRFTSIAMALIISGLVLWKGLRKSLMAGLIGILIIDSACSFYVLGFNTQFPRERAKQLDGALKIAVQRIGVMDSSSFGSFPSYYIGSNGPVTNQVFGWAWQGATTSKNLVELNTALEEGYYGFMFDRALELGADTLVFSKALVSDIKNLDKIADNIGYVKYEESPDTIIYKYPVTSSFGTSVNYEGIVIGSYAPNLIYLFPKLQTGISNYIDDYTFEDLRLQRAVFLSGFKYRNKKAAEDLLLKLSKGGVKVMVDITGMEGSFLGITAEPILINNNYNEIYYKDNPLHMEDFPVEYSSWKTYFINGIKNNDSYMVSNRKLINFIGKKDNDNLTFIGMNIPYYAFLTQNPNAVKILEEGLGLTAYELPERKIHNLEIKTNNNTVSIKLDSEFIGDSEDVIVPIAALDAFERVEGDFDITNNLIHLRTPLLTVRIIYPYSGTGIALSAASILFTILLSAFLYLKTKIMQREV